MRCFIERVLIFTKLHCTSPHRARISIPIFRHNAVSSNGGFGILPNPVDFLTTPAPSVLILRAHHAKVVVHGAVESDNLESPTPNIAETFIDMEG